MKRRHFVAASASAIIASTSLCEAANHSEATGFFRVDQLRGRWWLLTPEGKPFFSIGLNHIDPSPLRYIVNGELWQSKYGNSMERWLKESVSPDLTAWGFNSVGWTQEVVTRGRTNHRHSRAFTFEEYQWLDLPYCHMLPFADFHQWEVETRYPDFASSEFAEWCDYVARENCARMAQDPKLIGYFYIDCPTWIHTTQFTTWKGPLFDPARLKTESGRKELFELSTQYYRVTHDAIRRYDKNHLILGDRYEAARPIADEVIEAAKPYVDVICFQHFADPKTVSQSLAGWHEKSGKPVLLADHAISVKETNGSQRHDGQGYAEMLRLLRELSGCVGFHLCGAYLRNETRKRGLRQANESPDGDAIQAITQANRDTQQWMKEQ